MSVNYGRRILFRNIYKFRNSVFNPIFKHQHQLPVVSSIYLTNHTFSTINYQSNYLYYLSQKRRFKNPDPKHRVYRAARIPKYTDRWIERVILALCFGLCLIPCGFMYYYHDGTVPITNRKRILFIPFWLDEMIGVYTLKALGIGIEDEEAENEDNGGENENNDNIIDTDKDNPFDVSNPENKGGILNKTDHRVAHIQNIFDRILTANHLKKDCDNVEYNQLTPSMFKQFQEFNWKINVVDKLSIVNAMCAPGGKMIIYTGILREVVSTDDECAAIISHEIGHAICRHGIEQMQFTLFLIACGYLGAGLIGVDLTWGIEKLMTYGINLLLRLPMSRKAELEADEIAIYLMQNAGYNLDALTNVMKKLGEVEDRIGHIPEIMSTHPLTDSRVKILKEKIEKAKAATDSESN